MNPTIYISLFGLKWQVLIFETDLRLMPDQLLPTAAIAQQVVLFLTPKNGFAARFAWLSQ